MYIHTYIHESTDWVCTVYVCYMLNTEYGMYIHTLRHIVCLLQAADSNIWKLLIIGRSPEKPEGFFPPFLLFSFLFFLRGEKPCGSEHADGE